MQFGSVTVVIQHNFSNYIYIGTLPFQSLISMTLVFVTLGTGPLTIPQNQDLGICNIQGHYQ